MILNKNQGRVCGGGGREDETKMGIGRLARWWVWTTYSEMATSPERMKVESHLLKGYEIPKDFFGKPKEFYFVFTNISFRICLGGWS